MNLLLFGLWCLILFQLCLPCPIWHESANYDNSAQFRNSVKLLQNASSWSFTVCVYWSLPTCVCTSETFLCVSQGQGWWLWYSGSGWHAGRVCPWRLSQCCGFSPQPLLQTARPYLQFLYFLFEKHVYPSKLQRQSSHLSTHPAPLQLTSSAQPQLIRSQTKQPLWHSKTPHPDHPHSQSCP